MLTSDIVYRFCTADDFLAFAFGLIKFASLPGFHHNTSDETTRMVAIYDLLLADPVPDTTGIVSYPFAE